MEVAGLLLGFCSNASIPVTYYYKLVLQTHPPLKHKADLPGQVRVSEDLCNQLTPGG